MAAEASGRAMALGDLLPNQSLAAEVAALAVTGLQLDSRQIMRGDLFVAIPGVGDGNQNDGRHYITQAIARGAVAVLAEARAWPATLTDTLREATVPVVRMADLASAVSAIAGRFYGDPSEHLSVIGVTGTNGKTTCSQLLAQLYGRLGVPAGVVGTMGYGVLSATDGEQAALQATLLTTPDPVSSQAMLATMLAAGARYVVMEVSSHSLDQGRVDGVRLRGAVFTNLSRDHLDYHGGMDHYLAAKRKLFARPQLDFAVVNIDDPAAPTMQSALASGVRCYTCSLDNTAAAVYCTDLQLSATGLRAHIVSPWGSINIASQLIGEFNGRNLLAVIAAACASGWPLADVAAALPQLSPIPGRMQVIDAAAGPTVVVDYAHTPDALAHALAALRDLLPAQSSAKLWCVFGCGGDRDQGKRPAMGALAARLADNVVLTSDNPRSENPQRILDDIAAGFGRSDADQLRGSGTGSEPVIIGDRAAAIRDAITRAAPQDIVLIAGKGHETYQQVGDQRLPFNDLTQARLVLRERDNDRS